MSKLLALVIPCKVISGHMMKSCHEVYIYRVSQNEGDPFCFYFNFAKYRPTTDVRKYALILLNILLWIIPCLIKIENKFWRHSVCLDNTVQIIFILTDKVRWKIWIWVKVKVNEVYHIAYQRTCLGETNRLVPVISPYWFERKLLTNNPRTAGGLSHLRTAGGGVDDRPSQRTKKLRKIATSGKRRSTGRGKFYKKYSNHFLISSNFLTQLIYLNNYTS